MLSGGLPERHRRGERREEFSLFSLLPVSVDIVISSEVKISFGRKNFTLKISEHIKSLGL